VSEEFFSFFSPVFANTRSLVQSGPLPPESVSAPRNLSTGLMPPEARMAVILAWSRKKFTKNFSIGKKNRLPNGM
jgi:hypothetical protein